MQITFDEYKELLNAGREVYTIGPYGNLGDVNPSLAAIMCDEMDIKWYTTGWPYSSGINMFCNKDEYDKIIGYAKSRK